MSSCWSALGKGKVTACNAGSLQAETIVAVNSIETNLAMWEPGDLTWHVTIQDIVGSKHVYAYT